MLIEPLKTVRGDVVSKLQEPGQKVSNKIRSIDAVVRRMLNYFCIWILIDALHFMFYVELHALSSKPVVCGQLETPNFWGEGELKLEGENLRAGTSVRMRRCLLCNGGSFKPQRNPSRSSREHFNPMDIKTISLYVRTYIHTVV